MITDRANAIVLDKKLQDKTEKYKHFGMKYALLTSKRKHLISKLVTCFVSPT